MTHTLLLLVNAAARHVNAQRRFHQGRGCESELYSVCIVQGCVAAAAAGCGYEYPTPAASCASSCAAVFSTFARIWASRCRARCIRWYSASGLKAV